MPRTTFEFFQIPCGCFIGEKFDLQIDFIVFHGYKDAVDIFFNKLPVDQPICRIAFCLLEHAPQRGDVFAEGGVAVFLLFQFADLPLGRGNFVVALPVHLQKVPVADLAGDVIFEQLILFLFCKRAAGAHGFEPLPDPLPILPDGLIHGNIPVDQCVRIGLGLLENIEKDRLQFILVKRQGRAGASAVFDLARAHPFAVHVALLVPGVPPVVSGAAVRAEQLAGQQVAVVASALPLFNIPAAAGEHCVGCIPQFFGHNGRYDFAGFIFEHHPFLRWEEFLLFGEHVNDANLVADIVALVFGVGDYAGHGGVCNTPAIMVTVAFLPEQGFNLLHAVLVGRIELEQLAHHRGFLFIDHQTLIVLAIAENAAVAQYNTVFNRLLMPEFDAAGQLAQLVLRNTGHDGQAKLRVLLKGIDIVILKEDAHPGGKQVTGELDAVQRIAGESCDLLGDDQVKQARFAVLDHAMEVFTFLCCHAGKAFVDIAVYKYPCIVALDKVAVVPDLVIQRVKLFVAFTGYTGIEGDAQRDVVNRVCFHLLADGMYVHIKRS